MKVMVDIPNEAILKAAEAIKKKDGICKILPRARFHILDGRDNFEFNLLVCDARMGGEQTGISASHCKNCVNKNKQ